MPWWIDLVWQWFAQNSAQIQALGVFAIVLTFLVYVVIACLTGKQLRQIQDSSRTSERYHYGHLDALQRQIVEMQTSNAASVDFQRKHIESLQQQLSLLREQVEIMRQARDDELRPWVIVGVERVPKLIPPTTIGGSYSGAVHIGDNFSIVIENTGKMSALDLELKSFPEISLDVLDTPLSRKYPYFPPGRKEILKIEEVFVGRDKLAGTMVTLSYNWAGHIEKFSETLSLNVP